MEFDIVELGNVDGRLWLSMKLGVRQTCSKVVRPGRTSYNWLMVFDIVELGRETMAERGAEADCWTCSSKVGNSSAIIPSGIIEPGESLWIKLRNGSHYIDFSPHENKLYDVPQNTVSQRTITT